MQLNARVVATQVLVEVSSLLMVLQEAMLAMHHESVNGC